MRLRLWSEPNQEHTDANPHHALIKRVKHHERFSWYFMTRLYLFCPLFTMYSAFYLQWCQAVRHIPRRQSSRCRSDVNSRSRILSAGHRLWFFFSLSAWIPAHDWSQIVGEHTSCVCVFPNFGTLTQHGVCVVYGLYLFFFFFSWIQISKQKRNCRCKIVCNQSWTDVYMLTKVLYFRRGSLFFLLWIGINNRHYRRFTLFAVVIPGLSI